MRFSFVSLLAGSASFAAAAPSPLDARANTCGVKGYDKQKPQAYFYSTASTYRSLAACAAHCSADSACLSYATGSNACLHYRASA